MDYSRYTTFIAFGLCALVIYTRACNSNGYRQCNTKLEKDLKSAGDSSLCRVKDAMLENFKGCVNKELQGCHPGIARPQIENMKILVAEYNKLCPVVDEDEGEVKDDKEEIELRADEGAVERRQERTLKQPSLVPPIGAAVGEASRIFGFCESAGPSNCSKSLTNAIDPYTNNLDEFCKRVVEVLAVYRACVEAVISGCPEQTRQHHRDNMNTHIEGYKDYIKQCGEEGCQDIVSREEEMETCKDNSALADATSTAEKCRAVREETECAWRHAKGCPDTEETFSDKYDGLLEKYNTDHGCGISVGTVVVSKPNQAPTTVTVVPTKPSISNCLSLKEQGCFPGEHLDAKEAVEDVLVLLKHLEGIHEGKTPPYGPICQVFARMFNFDGKVDCTLQAVRQCFGSNYLEDFDPVKFSKEVKKNCLKMQIASVEECFH